MAHWVDRPHIGTDRIARSNFRGLVVVIILLCGAGYSAYLRPPTEPIERFLTRHWRAAPPAVLAGKAWVIDGDTINVSGARIRLEGIDAPEAEQTCADARGQPWPCGRTAAHALATYLGGRELTCAPTGFDRYRRVLAVCSLAGGADVNAWLVRQGWALAYGYAGTYHSEQDEAQAARRGIWAGTFLPPAEWRRRH
jgi:endonuclease YncB( thermonuclease family)